MIKIIAKNTVKADQVDAFITLAKQLVAETTQKDTGCIRYELYQDSSNSQVLTIIEEWEDQESLKKHSESKHFKEAAAAFPDLVEKDGEINSYRKLV